MFIIYSVILAILIGYIMGGQLKHLINRPLKKQWIALCAFIIQILIFSNLPLFSALPDLAIVILHFISYAGLLIFILFNIRVIGVLVVGMGIFCNALVIFLNGGYMPTLAENMKNTSMAKYAEAITQGNAVNNSAEITRFTLLPWLGDIFYVPSWIPFSNVFSIGDVIIAVGIFVYFVLNMRPMKVQK